MSSNDQNRAPLTWANAQHVARLLAAEGDVLKDRLKEIESRLESLPYKFRVLVSGDALSLSFDRTFAGSWAFTVHDIDLDERTGNHHERDQTLDQLSVLDRAAVATLLPALVRDFLAELDRRHKLVSDGLKATEEVEKLLAGLPKGGK